MKGILLFLGGMFFTIASFSNVNNFDLVGNEIEQEEGEINKKDAQGRKQGPWVIFGKDKPEKGYPAEGKIEEGPYKDNRKDGQWTKYHKDGMTKKLIGEYVNGRPKGAFVKYYEDGTTKEEGVFENGKHKGSLKRYHENGQVAQEKNFNDLGKEEGRQVIYYPNGQIQYEYTTKNGVKTGKAIRYTEDGQIKEETTYSETGEIVSQDKKDVQETAVKPIDVGTGVPGASKGSVKDGSFKSNGYNKVYNSDDELWMDGEFKNGNLWDGKLYKYDSDGILLKIEIWKNGKYHSDGQL
ncbi:MAG: toxin-antitoxin system YwqK family antitoxin [Putridiphycobacter sp.]